MTSPEERMAVIRRGIAALRTIESARMAALPGPDREDPDLLLEVRAIQQLADRMDFLVELEFDPNNQGDMFMLDAALTMHFTEEDIAAFDALATDVGAGTPYRGSPPTPDDAAALRALAALGRRYDRGEFMPPNSFFGIASPEA